ncbi:transposase family protein [Streptomyces antibioticus]
MSLPTPRPKVSSCVWTPPRSRSARPPAGRGGRRASVSGKKKQNTMKATVIADWQSRTSWADALRPGRIHDATAARNEGIAICFQHSSRRRSPPGRRLPRSEPRPPRTSDHTAQKTPAGSTARQSRINGNATDTATRPTASPSNTPSPITNTGST